MPKRPARLAESLRSVQILIALGVGVLLSGPAHANDDACRMGSAAASTQCRDAQWKTAERELQSAHDATVRELKESVPQLVKALVEAQRSWMKFREQYCTVYGRSRVEGNPWTAFWIGECRADEARSRTKALKHMLEER
jgi:uncharacterized protein YecT (DUF1311 family)